MLTSVTMTSASLNAVKPGRLKTCAEGPGKAGPIALAAAVADTEA